MPLILTNGLGTQAGAGGPGFEATSVTPGATSVQVNLNAAPSLTGPGASPSGYTITSSTGTVLQIRTITAQATSILISTEEHTGGLTYTLELPWVGINTTLGVPLSGIFSWTYTGVGSSPAIHYVRAVDARALLVEFGDYVIESEALIASNYTLDHGVIVESVSKINDIQYLLTTTRMLNGVTYNLTVSGIHTP